MPRLTIRNLSPEAYNALKELCRDSGATVGKAVSCCILAGHTKAREELESERCTGWYPGLADDLAELGRHMLVLERLVAVIATYASPLKPSP